MTQYEALKIVKY